MRGSLYKTDKYLEVCPICGRKPKIYRDFGYEASGFGAWCTIQCKRLFGKPHRKVESGKSTFDRALDEAIKDWNNMIYVIKRKED